jgi:hypothetical protein
LQERDAIDSYNESVWRDLGHPAFDEDFSLAIEDVEWWDSEKNEEV